MSRTVLGVTNAACRQDFIFHEHEPTKFHLQVVEESEFALKQAQRQRHEEENLSQRRNLRKIATVPWIVWDRARREKWDQSDWRRYFLLNPDYKNVVYGRL